jgi:hypothetical protein
MNEKVILGDETEFAGRCLMSNSRLFIYLDGLGLGDMGPVFDLFYEQPEKTQRIIYQAYENERVFEGYTGLWSMNRENGNINLTMVRDET